MAGNFQHMAGAGGNPMMMQQQQQIQGPQGQATGAIQAMLLQHIQNQSNHMSGWQSTVGINERYTQVWHM